jgi:nucleoside-diphosphate-sugar epimerase
LRFGSVFGAAPVVNFNRAVNRFVKQAFAGEPITVWRTVLDQLRPYTHIGDCVAAINFIIERDLFFGDVYNIVSENTTVRAILAEIEKHISPRTTSIIDDERMNNFSFGMDDTKIRSLGFSPQGTLEQGIIELLSVLNSRAI